MKERILKLLNAKQERKQDLLKRAKEATEVKELRSINDEMEVLNTEITDLRSMIDSLPDDQNDKELQGEHFTPGGEKRSSQPQGAFNPVASFRMGAGER